MYSIRKLLQSKDRAVLRCLLVPHAFIWKRRGCKVLDEKWDHLIVLDACRYDYFEECNTIECDLQKVNSVATYTMEWVVRNFKGKNCRDIVYVSANPYISDRILNKYNITFHHIKKVWDEELGTVPPENVTNAAIVNTSFQIKN